MKSRLMNGFRKTRGGGFYGLSWVVEHADARALSSLLPLYDALRSRRRRGMRTGIALGGSCAYMGEHNPFPADVDFTEMVLVNASGLHEAARSIARVIRDDVARIAGLSGFAYLELKAGKDPYTGKSLKWELQEVLRGFKLSGVHGGALLKRIHLHEAVLQRQMLKLDLIGKLNGIYREVTKVYRLAFRHGFPRGSSGTMLLTPENLNETIYQEIYFSRKGARLSARLSRVSERDGHGSPAVMRKYRHSMDAEIAHYGALGVVEKMSHLKLLKRWFNKLRIDHDEKSSALIVSLLRSEVNKANALKEALRIVGLSITNRLFPDTEIIAQLGALETAFDSSRLLELIGQEPGILSGAAAYLSQGRNAEALKMISSCVSDVEQWIEGHTRRFLMEKILLPNAEKLGIDPPKEANREVERLFTGLTRGARIRYLVYRHLRSDPRVSRRSYSKGEYILRFGEKAESCFIVLEGMASVAYGTRPEEAQLVREIEPFSIIGEIALVHREGKRTASVRALTDLVALEIPRAVFSELMLDSSFRLFVEFLSTDRLMEDGARTANPTPSPRAAEHRASSP